MNERRKDRSRFKDVALQTWLDAVAQRQKIDGIVVADAIGGVPARAGRGTGVQRL